jgi:Na+-translocating ferredoxin:NAD+ oxidoreductase RnfG subunit
MKSLTAFAATLAVLALVSEKLPWIIFQVRKAQIHLIIESQASRWPKAMTLPRRIRIPSSYNPHPNK